METESFLAINNATAKVILMVVKVVRCNRDLVAKEHQANVNVLKELNIMKQQKIVQKVSMFEVCC